MKKIIALLLFSTPFMHGGSSFSRMKSGNVEVAFTAVSLTTPVGTDKKKLEDDKNVKKANELNNEQGAGTPLAQVPLTAAAEADKKKLEDDKDVKKAGEVTIDDLLKKAGQLKEAHQKKAIEANGYYEKPYYLDDSALNTAFDEFIWLYRALKAPITIDVYRTHTDQGEASHPGNLLIRENGSDAPRSLCLYLEVIKLNELKRYPLILQLVFTDLYNLVHVQDYKLIDAGRMGKEHEELLASYKFEQKKRILSSLLGRTIS